MDKLKYVGKTTNDNKQHIVGIPARDLTDYDIEILVMKTDKNEEVIVASLIGSGLYVLNETFHCAEPGCDSIFKSWKAFHKHELKHIKTKEKDEI